MYLCGFWFVAKTAWIGLLKVVILLVLNFPQACPMPGDVPRA